MEKYVDICVVGAAGSGMAAAIVAKQKGAGSVLLLEKQHAPGGCTVMSAGMMGVDTPVQRRFGFHYSTDEAFHQVMNLFNWGVDAKLVRKWINGSGENFEWLEELGVKYDFCCTETADEREFENYHHRMGEWDGEKWVMKMQGPVLVRALRENCEKYGVELMTNTRASHLLIEDGRVTGVKAENAEGELIVHAGAVILATGSFSSNPELVKRFFASDEYKDVRFMGGLPHSTGDGILMAEEAGAFIGRTGALYIGPHNHYPKASEVVSVLMRRPHYMKVNISGERFVDESLPMTNTFGWMQCVSVDKQPGKRCYTILSQKNIDDLMADKVHNPPRWDTGCQLDAPASFGPGPDFEKGQDPLTWRERIPQHLAYEEERGIVKKCATLDEAAAWIGCDAQTLKNTAAHYDLCCSRGYDDELLKDPRYLEPCGEGPYYVILGRTGIDNPLGGVIIDNRQRVLRPDGSVIAGLYAAGIMCSGWFNGTYAYFGSEMSFTIYSGRSAGAEAAHYIANA